MKEIRIIQKNNKDIIMFDDDEKDLLEYTNELRKIVDSNKIVILSTSVSNAILRPSQIDAVVVSETSIYDNVPNKNLDSQKEIPIENQSEDIISDE